MDADDRIGAIFDMDGVLVDSAEPHFRSWQRLGEELGTPVARKQFDNTFGRQNRDIIPILFGSVSDVRLAELGERKETIYRAIVREKMPIVEGAVELVRNLHANGIHLALGSSGPRANVDLVLHAMGVAGLMDAVITADEVTHGKPDPQVFTLACRRLDILPTRCVVVEDAPAGVEAARRAGARSVAVLIHHPITAFADADLTVPRLADLTPEMLCSIARG